MSARSKATSKFSCKTYVCPPETMRPQRSVAKRSYVHQKPCDRKVQLQSRHVSAPFLRNGTTFSILVCHKETPRRHILIWTSSNLCSQFVLFAARWDNYNNDEDINNPDELMFQKSKNNIQIESNNKEFTDINTYQPSGNLIYNKDLLKRIEDKTKN